jgi:hypothetical protein
MRSLLFLFEPLTSKLRYPCKPRPKDQRTHAKNLQTPQVNHIRPFYSLIHIPISFGVIFVRVTVLLLRRGVTNAFTSFFLSSGSIDTVQSDFWGLLATLIGIRSLDIFSLRQLFALKEGSFNRQHFMDHFWSGSAA